MGQSIDQVISIDKFSDLKELITVAANNILPRTFLGKVDVSKEKIDGSRSFISYNLNSVLQVIKS